MAFVPSLLSELHTLLVRCCLIRECAGKSLSWFMSQWQPASPRASRPAGPTAPMRSSSLSSFTVSKSIFSVGAVSQEDSIQVLIVGSIAFPDHDHTDLNNPSGHGGDDNILCRQWRHDCFYTVLFAYSTRHRGRGERGDRMYAYSCISIPRTVSRAYFALEGRREKSSSYSMADVQNCISVHTCNGKSHFRNWSRTHLYV